MPTKSLETISFIEQSIGYKFNNKQLLQQAFTRKSYSEENPGVLNNEVLEFIGDTILSQYVLIKLIHKYMKLTPNGLDSSENEKQLTEDKQYFINNQYLAKRIEILNLHQFLIMGNGDIKKDVQLSVNPMADLLESIIGAVAIDSNYDSGAISDVVDNLIDFKKV